MAGWAGGDLEGRQQHGRWDDRNKTGNGAPEGVEQKTGKTEE